MPTVSVVMPMYNSVKFVRQAIESLLDQTYKDIEVIVINDGSKDGCADVVKEIKDDRLIFVDRENRGFVNTLNECISMARGKYIARLDDDDWCYPTRIEKQVKYLEEHPGVALVGTLHDEQTLDEIKRYPETAVRTPQEIRYGLLFDNFAFAHSSFMMRRDVLEDNDIRYEMFKQVPDYHMITRICRYGDVARIHEHLVVYRIHPAQSTQVRSAQMKQGEIDRAREWYIDTLPLEEAKKTALKKGILRKIRTADEFRAFDGALDEYRRGCGSDSEISKGCRAFLYEKCMMTQLCTPSLLAARLKAGNNGWMLSGEGLKFAVKCLISRNPHYLETEVDI